MNGYDLVLNHAHRGLSPKFEDATRARLNDKKCPEYYGFKVYSQNDEDGIIEEIFNRIGTTNKIFIEFGVTNGLECNSHYLLHKGWRGLWIEGDKDYLKDIREKFAPVIADGKLNVLCEFVTRENINELFDTGGVTGEIDLLSIDIDGNDWHVWRAIDVVKPRVVVIEYNAQFPPNCQWIQAYNKRHIWDYSDWHGASFKSLELLGRELGYQLVGTNFTGVNAFFVRKDLARDLFSEPATAENLYNPARFSFTIYANNHPAKYCLVGQRENFGLLNYKPNCDAIALKNFGEEVCEENYLFRLMSARWAEILVRNKAKVALPYFVLSEDADKLAGMTLKISVDEKILSQVPVQAHGLIEMNLPPSQEPLEVALELPKVFIDKDGNGHGLAIIFEVNERS